MKLKKNVFKVCSGKEGQSCTLDAGWHLVSRWCWSLKDMWVNKPYVDKQETKITFPKNFCPRPLCFSPSGLLLLLSAFPKYPHASVPHLLQHLLKPYLLCQVCVSTTSPPLALPIPPHILSYFFIFGSTYHLLTYYMIHWVIVFSEYYLPPPQNIRSAVAGLFVLFTNVSQTPQKVGA